MTKLAETAPQNERMDAITTFDHYDGDDGDVDDDVVEDDAEDDDDKGDCDGDSEFITTATVDPALATMVPIHKERMN